MIQDINKFYLLGAFAILLAAILWSFDGTIIRPNFYHFPALNIVFLEHLLGATLLSPFLFWGSSKIFLMTKKDIFSLLWVSFFGGLVGTFFITEAYFAAFRGETTFATVIILQKLQPIFALTLAAILLNEKLTKCFYLWASVAIFSGYMIAYGSLGKDIFSVNIFHSAAFYAFLAAFAFGSSTVFGKNLVTHLGFRVATALRFFMTSFLAVLAIIFFGDFSSLSSLTFFHWQLLFLITFTSGAVALFLYYFGLKRVPASHATIFELAWPLTGIFFDWYFNGNILSLFQIIFSILLLLSFFIIIEEYKKEKY